MDAKSNRSLLQVDAIGIAICLACAGAWYLLGWSPLTEAKASRQFLAEQAAERESKLAEMEDRRRLHQERLQALDLQISEVRQPLEPAEHINSRLKTVTDMASECTLRIDEIRPGSATVLEHYTGVPIRVSGEGGYAAATRFMHEVQKRYRDIGVTGFELRGEPQAPEKPTTFVVDLLWYAKPHGAK
jgi:Tfp pilus assembly protein PilO